MGKEGMYLQSPLDNFFPSIFVFLSHENEERKRILLLCKQNVWEYALHNLQDIFLWKKSVK